MRKLVIFVGSALLGIIALSSDAQADKKKDIHCKATSVEVYRILLTGDREYVGKLKYDRWFGPPYTLTTADREMWRQLESKGEKLANSLAIEFGDSDAECTMIGIPQS